MLIIWGAIWWKLESSEIEEDSFSQKLKVYSNEKIYINCQVSLISELNICFWDLWWSFSFEKKFMIFCSLFSMQAIKNVNIGPNAA